MDSDVALTEFDEGRKALIEPRALPSKGPVPERAVLCFFQDVIDKVCGDTPDIITTFPWGPRPHRAMYRLRTEASDVAVISPGIGAPLAVGILEDAIATGCRKFVACGGAGALIPGLALGHVVVPNAAVRDEGTSFHYAPPAREIAADSSALEAALSVLSEREIPYTLGKTWTTDAPYRETPARIEQRRLEGCVTVEMEAAAFFAVAQFRGVPFAQLLYAGDDVSGEAWDHRAWHTSSVREDLFWLAVEVAQRV